MGAEQRCLASPSHQGLRFLPAASRSEASARSPAPGRLRQDDGVPALPTDYDSDPERWGSRDPGWRLAADVHEMVAARVAAQGLRPVLDVGSGRGRLRQLLPTGW